MQLKVQEKNEVKKSIPFNELLQKQTIDYWRVSQAWNGFSREKITTEKAFGLLNGILKECNPSRPLAKHVFVLKDCLVEFGTKKHVADNVNTEAKITVL